MKPLQRLPRLFKFLFLAAAANVTVYTLMRVVFFLAFREDGGGSGLLRSFYIGFKFDLRLAVFINLPVALAFFRPIDMFGPGIGKRLWSYYYGLSMFAALLFYSVDLGHYAYLKERLNATVLRFFHNPIISFGMVWETYPVITGLAALIAVSLLFGLAMRHMMIAVERRGASAGPGWQKILVSVIAVLLFASGIYGKFSYYPLRWSDAYYSTNPFASAVALNPVLFFFDTLKHREKSYDAEEVRRYYDLMSEYLGVTEPDKEGLNFKRFIEKPSVQSRLNVVMVFLESFAAYKTGAFGNPLNPTPNFDSVAADSIFFRRFYTPSTGTARSVFAAVTGIPDVERNETATRDPIIVRQWTIVNSFRDYDKYYFIGGSANWANIRGLLFHNIPGLKMYEEGSFSSQRINVWGISDLDLFLEANDVLKEAKKPFFAIIQTSGSHRPYTIPEDNHGFRTTGLKDDEVKKFGFEYDKEYEAFRFLDHSIGVFMEKAKKEKYFRDTVFVFFGDHGLSDKGENMPRAESELGLIHYHVPLLIYAPGVVEKGAAYDKIASEPDILPTLASFTSNSYLNTTLGKDLLEKGPDEKRYAFTIREHHAVPLLGLLSDDYYFTMKADGTEKSLHAYYSSNPVENVSSSLPDIAASMEKLARAYYETSKYMIYHNAPPEAGTENLRVKGD